MSHDMIGATIRRRHRGFGPLLVLVIVLHWWLSMTTTTVRSLFLSAALALCLTAGCSDSDDDDTGGTAGMTDESPTSGSGGADSGDSGSGGAGNGGAGSGGAGNGGADSGDSGSGGSGEDGGALSDSGMPVDLGTARDFAILAKTGISTVPDSEITGDIGVSPAAASYITGFSLSADATNVFATSSQVVGKVFAADYEPPTASKMTTAISDMENAFSDAAGRAPDVTELGDGDIGGMSLPAGTYKWSTGLLVPTNVTLAGDEDGVWIFQIAGDLTLSSGKQIVLEGGAHSGNVFWQVSGEVTLGTTAHLEGTVLSQTAITLGTGASVNGRLLAQTSVDLDSSTVVEPAQ
jgi:hypothetical protein